MKLPPSSPLGPYLGETVEKLITLDPLTIPPELAERHRIYSLMLMSIVSCYWNGNKRGRKGTYPFRTSQVDGACGYVGGDYLGHNIASIAVDADGFVIDFGFNHNEIFNSSVEHAESRLIRRVFSLAQLSDSWNVSNPNPSAAYGNLLTKVSVYTSLESCAQCAGIMALGQVKELIFLQQDPGQYLVGNIMHQLTKASNLRAPRPIEGAEFGFSFYDRLNQAYEKFAAELSDQKPFHISPSGNVDKSPSITSFLCTDEAQVIYNEAAKQFAGLDAAQIAYPQYKPAGAGAKTLTNIQVLEESKQFLAYARDVGRRTTAHKL